jgi:hypothetical protein
VKQEWTNVRLLKATADRLQLVLATLAHPSSQGRAILPTQLSEALSWDFAVRLLLDRNARHLDRGRRSKSRKGEPRPERS